MHTPSFSIAAFLFTFTADPDEAGVPPFDGEHTAADALDLFGPGVPGEPGPFLTIALDGIRPRLVAVGDAAPHLAAYADAVAREHGLPPFTGTSAQRAHDAFAVAAEHAANERCRELALEWSEPDPDTWRPIRLMSERTREANAEHARQDAEHEEAKHLGSFLVDALRGGASAAPPQPSAPQKRAA